MDHAKGTSTSAGATVIRFSVWSVALMTAAAVVAFAAFQ